MKNIIFQIEKHNFHRLVQQSIDRAVEETGDLKNRPSKNHLKHTIKKGHFVKYVKERIYQKEIKSHGEHVLIVLYLSVNKCYRK